LKDIIIICEKPDSCARIANALAESNLKTKRSIYGVNYYEFLRNGKRHISVSAVGHLFGLRQVESGSDYPIFDAEWVPSFEIAKKSSFSERYFNTIKEVAKNSKDYDLISACDFDNEGSLISERIIRLIFRKSDAKRMKFSTLTKSDLIDAYDNMMPHLDWGNIIAGETRHYLDWFYGINTSRALMSAIKKASKRFAILSAGRVQAPTLVLLADREMEIRNFVPTPYWQLQLILSIDGNEFIALHEKDKIWDKEEAEKIFDRCKGKPAIVDEVRKRKYSQPPPPPFNITSLQTEAYRLFGFSPQYTMSIAQKLYTSAAISYPRTASEKCPPQIGYRQILEALSRIEKYKSLCKSLLVLKFLKPIEGRLTDSAHECFPQDTKICLNDHGNTVISNIVKNVKWSKNTETGNFYAPCQKEIKIFAWDEKNREIVSARIVKLLKTFTKNKKLLKIETERGELKTTPNHLVYSLTEKGFGFKPASQLEDGDFLFIRNAFESELVEDKTILTEEHIVKTFRKNQQIRIKNYLKVLEERRNNKSMNEIAMKLHIPKSTVFHWLHGRKPKIYKTVEKLKKLGLLPLYAKNPKTKVISRLIGHIFGDGSLGHQQISMGREEFPVSSFMGTVIKDIEEIRNDIRGLEFTVNKNRFHNNKFSFVSHDSTFNRLLIALGAPTGDKVLSSQTMPSWILNGSKEIKKEFISSYFGCELEKIRINVKNKRDFDYLRSEVHKCEGTLSSGIKFYRQIKGILREFEIESVGPKILKGAYIREDGKKSLSIQISINNNRENLLRFLTNIGYKYCSYRSDIASRALAFLLKRKFIIEKRERLRKESKILYNKGFSVNEISKLVGIPRTTVGSWMRGEGSKEKHVPASLIEEFKDFNEKITNDVRYVRIKKISEVRAPKFVYDFEIEPNHTFLANGFVVHNCIHPTVEPPRDIKYLSQHAQKIYDLICRRFLALFAKNAIRESVDVVIDVDGNKFLTGGRRTLDKGWMEFYGPYAKFDELIIPDLKKGGRLDVKDLEMLDKETAPPLRYSQASIIKELEKKNLGTRATRSAILQTLYDRNYIADRNICVTDLGLKISSVIKKYVPDFADEKLTRKFEEELEGVMSGKEKKEKVLDDAKIAVTKICDEFRQHEDEIGKELGEAIMQMQDVKSVLGKCPNCGKDLKVMFSPKTRKYFVGCTGYKDGCRTSYPLPHGASFQRMDKVCDKCKTPIIKVIRRGRRTFNMCLDPKCETKADWGKRKVSKSKLKDNSLS